MSPHSCAAFVFIAISVAALAGFRLQRDLPEKFTDDSIEGNVRSVLEGPMTGSMRISTGTLERALAITGQ